MPSRRAVLKLGIGGLLASAYPSFADEPKKGGTLYVLVYGMKIGDKTINHATLSIDPDSGVWQLIREDVDGPSRVSSDGKYIVYTGVVKDELCIALSELRAEGEPRKVAVPVAHGLWSADPSKLLVSEKDKGAWIVSTDGKTRSKLPLPEHIEVVDWSRDGKWFLINSGRESDDPQDKRRIWVASVVDEAGKVVGVLPRPDKARGTFSQTRHRFTADGRSIVYLFIDKEDPKNPLCTLRKIGIDGKDDRLFRGGRDEQQPVDVCFSPDGRRAALATFHPNPDENGRFLLWGRKLEITDADGKNGREIEIPGANIIFLMNWC